MPANCNIIDIDSNYISIHDGDLASASQYPARGLFLPPGPAPPAEPRGGGPAPRPFVCVLGPAIQLRIANAKPDKTARARACDAQRQSAQSMRLTEGWLALAAGPPSVLRVFRDYSGRALSVYVHVMI